jgi:hypothetical protein
MEKAACRLNSIKHLLAACRIDTAGVRCLQTRRTITEVYFSKDWQTGLPA